MLLGCSPSGTQKASPASRPHPNLTPASTSDSDANDSDANDSDANRNALEITPFTNAAVETLGEENAFIDNRYPGVAIFDYDRDGDLDFYVTSFEAGGIFQETVGGPNKLFRNDGAGKFTEVAGKAGVGLPESNSSGVVACDFNNDGYQDLYVGAQGRIGDKLDYRSTVAAGLREVVKDRLLLNKGNGTFKDITDKAFGKAVNLRSTLSIACADVDGDGWLDLLVANRADQDFVDFRTPWHHGHYNVLYRNNGDLTFTDITEQAGLIGPQITLRDPLGDPVTFQDPETGAPMEGYRPKLVDERGNRVGDPTGQTWSALFFDHDNDGDPDLWLADDGDRLKIYRNDSTVGKIAFTPIGRAMGIDRSGAWMAFALGDYDNDGDLDIFVSNLGFHPLTRPLVETPGGDGAYAAQFAWGTCLHYLLRNDGVREAPGAGVVPVFSEVAGSTVVKPSRLMPPASLDPANIHPSWQVPTGLAAYDFAFGTVFLDYDNDGDLDLSWVGSIMGHGEGPGGEVYPSAGRLLRGDGHGSFEDITVEAHVLDIQNVDYSILDPTDPGFDRERQRIDPKLHENGKGLAKGDLNGDGYVDLIAANSNGLVYTSTPQRVRVARGPLFLWINGGGERNWITLRLKGRRAVDGTGSNADAVGARIFVEARVDGQNTLRQVQEVLTGSTFLSMSSLDVNFGMGVAMAVQRIVIKWPSGIEQVLENLDVNQVVEITEPKR